MRSGKLEFPKTGLPSSHDGVNGRHSVRYRPAGTTTTTTTMGRGRKVWFGMLIFLVLMIVTMILVFGRTLHILII